MNQVGGEYTSRWASHSSDCSAAAMGVAAARLGLEDSYVEALVSGDGEQWLEDHSEQRDAVCKSDYGRYLRILASEAMLRGAAAELQQMATPE